jgi:hypothetical protein
MERSSGHQPRQRSEGGDVGGGAEDSAEQEAEERRVGPDDEAEGEGNGPREQGGGRPGGEVAPDLPGAQVDRGICPAGHGLAALPAWGSLRIRTPRNSGLAPPTLRSQSAIVTIHRGKPNP